jgi:Chalcone isomerase-like
MTFLLWNFNMNRFSFALNTDFHGQLSRFLKTIACAGLMGVSILGFAQTATPTAKPSLIAPAKPGSVNIEGVIFEPDMQLGGTTIVLNGTGIRTRAFFKVYAAALYLPAQAKTPDAIYASKGPKRLKVTMLREIESGGFGKTMSQIMSDNLPRERLGRCIPGIMKLGEVFAFKKKMGVGEWYAVDEIPGKGTVVSINGVTVAEIAEPEFFTCLMHNYFGEKPADSSLKKGLMGLAN